MVLIEVMISRGENDEAVPAALRFPVSYQDQRAGDNLEKVQTLG
jgi:hypothetical protein